MGYERPRRPTDEELVEDAAHCKIMCERYLGTERRRRRYVQVLVIGGPVVAFFYALFNPLFDTLPRANFFEAWAFTLVAVLPFLYNWKLTSDKLSTLEIQSAVTDHLLLDRGLRDQDQDWRGPLTKEPWYSCPKEGDLDDGVFFSRNPGYPF